MNVRVPTKFEYPIKPDHILVCMNLDAAGRVKYHWQFKTSNLSKPNELIQLTLDLLFKQFGPDFLQGVKAWGEKKQTTTLIENLQKKFPGMFHSFNPQGFG